MFDGVRVKTAINDLGLLDNSTNITLNFLKHKKMIEIDNIEQIVIKIKDA